MGIEEREAIDLIARFDAIVADVEKTQRARLGEIEALVSELAKLPLDDRYPLGKQIIGKIRSPKLREQRDAVLEALMAE